MLRKVILFMITSGLAGKLWRSYRGRNAAPTAPAPRHVSRSRKEPLRSV